MQREIYNICKWSFVLVQTAVTKYNRLGSLNHHLFLTVLKAGKPNQDQGTSRLQCSMRALFQVAYGLLFSVSSQGREKRRKKQASVSSHKDTNPIPEGSTWST